MSYFDEIENEDENEMENKEPYGEISSREPISDPRGRNPAMENGLGSLQNNLGSMQGKYGLVAPHPSLSPDSQISYNLKNQLSMLQNQYGLKKPGPGIPSSPLSPLRQSVMSKIKTKFSPGLNPNNQEAVNRIISDMDHPQDAGPISPAPSPPPGAPLNLEDLKSQGQMPGTVDPSVPPAPNSPPFNSPAFTGNGNDSDMGIGQAALLNPSSSYFLAGAMAAQGGKEPLNPALLSNSLDARNKLGISQIQNDQSTRAKVANAIAMAKQAQAFTHGENQNKLASNEKIAGMKADMRPGVNGNPQKPMTEYQNARLEQTANGNFDKNTKSHVTMFNSMDRVEHIIQGIKDGSLKSSPNLNNQLASDMNVINSGSSTVSGTDHARIKSLVGDLKGLYSYLTGSATNTIPPGQLDNLTFELGVLRNSTIGSFKNAVRSLQAGTNSPMMKSIYQRRHDAVLSGNPVAPVSNDQDGSMGPSNPDDLKATSAPFIKKINDKGVIKTVQKMPNGTWEEVQ